MAVSITPTASLCCSKGLCVLSASQALYSNCSFSSLSFLRTMRQVISVAIINAITSPTAAKTYHGPKIGLDSLGNIAPNIIIASKRPYPREVNISNIFNFLSKLIFFPPLWIGGKRCLPPMYHRLIYQTNIEIPIHIHILEEQVYSPAIYNILEHP